MFYMHTIMYKPRIWPTKSIKKMNVCSQLHIINKESSYCLDPKFLLFVQMNDDHIRDISYSFMCNEHIEEKNIY